jgi:hypothetical protein
VRPEEMAAGERKSMERNIGRKRHCETIESLAN